MSAATVPELGTVQKLMLRTVVRNGVLLKRTGLGDISEDFNEDNSFWHKRWVDRKTIKSGVHQRRENDVTKASNRVSVSRATHALVERELLDAKYVATAVLVDGVEKIAHAGEPRVRGEQSDASPTYSLVRLSNKGEKVVRKLRSRERNVWQSEVEGRP